MALRQPNGGLAAILSNKIVVLHLRSYVSLVDLLCLQKACRRLVPSLQQYVPSPREVIAQSFPKFQSLWVELWKVLPRTGAVLHGSFLLHCLLRPLGSTAYTSIFNGSSDLDFLEPSGAGQNSALIQLLKGRSQMHYWPETREGSRYMRRTVFRFPAPEPDVDHVTIDLPQEEVCIFNAETFCHERRRPTIFDRLREGLDLPFSKIAYDGQTLFVGDLRALQHRSCPLPVEYQTFDKYIYHRVSSYLRKGFRIEMSEKARENFQAYERQHKTRSLSGAY